MTREQAQALLDTYRNFPKSKLFALKPHNYPLFHLLESFAKGWRIEAAIRHGGRVEMIEVNDIDFEFLAENSRLGKYNIWKFVARNPQATNTILGFVQEDLYARYVGKCTPLKGPLTTWTFIPHSVIQEAWEKGEGIFEGLIGKHTRLYQIEIDLSTTDIFGERNPKVPWHYLQQTIDWKPWTGRIDWNNADHPQEPTTQPDTNTGGGNTLRDRFERVRATAEANGELNRVREIILRTRPDHE